MRAEMGEVLLTDCLERGFLPGPLIPELKRFSGNRAVQIS